VEEINKGTKAVCKDCQQACIKCRLINTCSYGTVPLPLRYAMRGA